MKWYKSYYFLIPVIILVGFLNYNPQLLFPPSSYYHWGWQCALVATVIYISLFRLRDRNNWKRLLGINFTKKDLSVIFILTCILTILSYWLMHFILTAKGHSFRFLLADYNQFERYRGAPLDLIVAVYVFYIPQTFNEEMIVGALLLKGLKEKYKKVDDLVIAAIVALIFSLMHQALYKFSPVQPGDLLKTTTLVSLFMVGMIRNILILRTGKITYSWAIHLSWNLVFFTGLIILSNGEFASEPERFNLILGDIGLMIVLVISAFLIVYWKRIKAITKNTGLVWNGLAEKNTDK